MMGGKPTYDLQHLQQLVGQGELSRMVTGAARAGGIAFGVDVTEIIAAVLELRDSNFYKTMEASQCPGLWQDVYHLTYRGIMWYIKLQLSPDGRAVIVQFKQR
jgi:motility quorum-sensing regulator/GCU-specific mRNA interferase toxin